MFQRNQAKQAIETWSDDNNIRTLLEHVPEWYQRAACQHADPVLFFPSRKDKPLVVIAQYCGRYPGPALCPVRDECLKAGMDRDDGIWGGTTGDYRKKLRKAERPANVSRQMSQPSSSPAHGYYRRRLEEGWCSACANGSHRRCYHDLRSCSCERCNNTERTAACQ